MINAAVISTWGETPKYSPIELPEPTPSQVRIKVLAAGLHTLVRSRAAGKHFSVANTSPPHVPGTDGVGTLIPSGELVYFNCLTAASGSFADEINVEAADVFTLPLGADPDAVAVLGNPAMSSWMALVARAGVDPKQEQDFSVAIVGATGVSGQAAVQIAAAMGATRIVAIGRAGPKLDATRELGATACIELRQPLAATDFSAAADVDIVLDYLWGDVMLAALSGIAAKRAIKTRRLTWVEIGALAGNEVAVSAALLRKANICLLGCGPGSWSYGELHAQIPAILAAIADGGMTTSFVVRGLSEVEDWWGERGEARVLVKP
ncbi:hypothetical protein C7974DRAFT_417548 [Boeremia exigua]|uniref:uncharacterized protein n=1 Tax=Boeremia exigua TaxID=749465 RepID=UPI001E8D74B2|nr:uncharacterized protein C7974DRAFT_417548 [Boeremia exigua]KAH6615370.1 hypothetical protein C7974DRAFT_417548 [Boeremia exigua]